MDLNRRSLIKGSVAAGVTALFGTAAQASTKVPAKWDESHDVVVIGSGFAAAIEAKKAGADTVVLEKMPTAGGNSIINGGILTATCCPQQLKHGIKDSPELLAFDHRFRNRREGSRHGAACLHHCPGSHEHRQDIQAVCLGYRENAGTCTRLITGI